MLDCAGGSRKSPYRRLSNRTSLPLVPVGRSTPLEQTDNGVTLSPQGARMPAQLVEEDTSGSRAFEDNFLSTLDSDEDNFSINEQADKAIDASVDSYVATLRADKAFLRQPSVKRTCSGLNHGGRDMELAAVENTSEPCDVLAPHLMTPRSPRESIGPRENTGISDVSILSEMTSLTEQLKSQVVMLQGELLDQKDKLTSLQKDVWEMTLAKVATPDAPAIIDVDDAAGSTSRDVSPSRQQHSLSGMMNGHTLEHSPRREGRLSRALRTAHRVISRSPSRSNSPKKVDFKDINDIQTSFLDPPSNSVSPQRSHSPSRRIEARIAPRLMSSITNLVDAQVQNLELRMAGIEASFQSFRQSTVSDCTVKGMSGSDLKMLSGLNVIRSQPDESQMQLLGPTEESAWDPPSRYGCIGSQERSKSGSRSRFSPAAGLSRVLNFRRRASLPSRGKAALLEDTIGSC